MSSVNREQRIITAYRTAGHPIAFSSPAAVARYFGITRRKAEKILQKIDSYTLHKEFKRPRVFNPYYVRQRRTLIQGDLIDIKALKRENDNISYILLNIDVFSRFVWLYPLPSKSANAMINVLQQWLQTIEPTRQGLFEYQVDKGTEFHNRQVKR